MDKDTVKNGKIEVIYHKGKRIIYADFTGLSADHFIKAIAEMEDQSLSSPEKNILHLLNFTDCWMNNEAKERADKMMKKLMGAGFTVKTAGFGAARVQGVIARGVKADMYIGRTKADALEHLTD